MANQKTFDKQSEVPKGWYVWGNYGDGKWRAGRTPQTNDIEPQATREAAIEAIHKEEQVILED